MVFICSPFRGDSEKNIALAQNICRVCSSCNILGIAPHLYFPQFLNDDDPEERMFGIKQGLSLMELCDEVWVFGEMISEGMSKEISYAKTINKPVRFYPDIEVWKETMKRDGKER